VLNLGHSIGHAVETVTGFNVNHGQAVAMGTAVAGTISVRMGLMRPMELNRISYLFNRCGLPSSLPGLNPGALMEALKHDKKVTRGRLRFVLPVRVGQVVVRDVDPALVAEVLAGP
jgi:3-dehydroquinate synthase